MPSLKALFIGATFHNLSYSLPITIVFSDRLKELLILLVGPLALDQVWVQCFEPPLPTLLGRSFVDVF